MSVEIKLKDDPNKYFRFTGRWRVCDSPEVVLTPSYYSSTYNYSGDTYLEFEIEWEGEPEKMCDEEWIEYPGYWPWSKPKRTKLSDALWASKSKTEWLSERHFCEVYSCGQ